MKHSRQPIDEGKRLIWLIIFEGGSGPKSDEPLLRAPDTMLGRGLLQSHPLISCVWQDSQEEKEAEV